jgi:hypothetical protein
MNVPAVALDLVYRFTHTLPFSDQPLPTPWLNPHTHTPTHPHTLPPPSRTAKRMREKGGWGLWVYVVVCVCVCVLAVGGSAVFRRVAQRKREGYEEVQEGGGPERRQWR